MLSKSGDCHGQSRIRDGRPELAVRAKSERASIVTLKPSRFDGRSLPRAFMKGSAMMLSRRHLLLIACGLLLGNLMAVGTARGTAKTRESVYPDLSGRWQLNPELSEN